MMVPLRVIHETWLERMGDPGALGRAAQRALGSTPSTGASTGPTAVTQAAPVNPAAFTPGNSGPTLPAWQVAQQHSPSSQQPSTGQARPWLVPAVIIAAAALLLGGIGVVIGLLARQNTAPPTGAAPSSGQTVPTPTPSYQPEAPPSPPTQLGPTVEPSIAGPPGTDAQGWIAYPAARCDPGTQPAAIARTTQSVLVVCQIQPGTFYYRGVRLSDGASIELANAVRSSVGFDVTNPTDGTRYQIRPTSLTIAPPDGKASTEPILEYASS